MEKIYLEMLCQSYVANPSYFLITYNLYCSYWNTGTFHVIMQFLSSNAEVTFNLNWTFWCFSCLFLFFFLLLYELEQSSDTSTFFRIFLKMLDIATRKCICARVHETLSIHLSLSISLSLYIDICIYIYVYICICVCIFNPPPDPNHHHLDSLPQNCRNTLTPPP